MSIMKNALKIILFFSIIAIVQFTYGWGNLFALFEQFAKANANPIVFLFVISFGCAIGFPVSFCTLFAGAAFGWMFGSGLSIVGIFASSLIGYFVGKFFAPDEFIEKIKRRLNLKGQRSMFDLNFYVRAVPGLPYSMQNLLLGAMNSDLKMYLLLSVSIQGIIAVAMNALGAYCAESGTTKFWIFSVVVCIIILIRFGFRRFYKN